jgi:hypothetical protein
VQKQVWHMLNHQRQSIFFLFNHFKSNCIVMKNVRLFSVIVLLGALAFVGCSKGSGSTGATGATGPAGPAGPDSVLHSAWVQLAMTATSTEQVGANVDTVYEMDIAAPAVTQTILDSGVVLGYISTIDQNGNTNVFNASEALQVTYAVGDVSLFSVGADYSYANTGFLFRYVIIPGSQVTGDNIVSGPLKGYTKKQVQGMSYDAVNKLLAAQGIKSSTN